VQSLPILPNNPSSGLSATADQSRKITDSLYAHLTEDSHSHKASNMHSKQMPKHKKLHSNIIISRELSQPKYHTIMKILLMSVTQRCTLCKEKGMGNIFTFLKPEKTIIIQENRIGGDAVE